MRIERDARVLATDGEVGRVTHVIADHQTREITEIVVESGGREMILPIGAVAEADGRTVRLRGSRAMLAQGSPFARDEFHGLDDDAAEAQSRERAVHGGAPLRAADPDAVDIGDVAAVAPAMAVPRADERLVRRPPARAEGELVVPVAEERLGVAKQQVELGAVEIHKEVVQEQVSVPVELRHEEVRVRERDVADRPLAADDTAFQEGVLRVPVRGEEAVVTKEAVVTGEVVIDKERIVERQEVADTVRKERVEVDERLQGRPRTER